MPSKFPNEAMCLEHFLKALDSLPQSLSTNTAKIYESRYSLALRSEAIPTRQQPSRGAKRPTNFYEIENPRLSKRRRGENEDDEDTRPIDGRPCKRRRLALRSMNYDVDLANTDKEDRTSELLWAAQRLLKRVTDMPCCFSDHPVVCSACERKKLQPKPKPAEPSQPPQKKKSIKLVGRLAQPPVKKHIKLVGRLAPFAHMKPSKVTIAGPPQWNPKKGVRPFMMVRFHKHEFAVDFCKDLRFVPIGLTAAEKKATVKLFGCSKN